MTNRSRARSYGVNAVAVLGLGAADGDDVKTVGASLERSHDIGRDADDVPGSQLLSLVVEQDPTGTGDHDVDNQ